MALIASKGIVARCGVQPGCSDSAAASITSINADRSRLFLGEVWQLKVTGSSEGSHENYPPMRSIHVGFKKDELKDLVGPLSGGDDL